jgi:uncharacterized protein DUF4232
MSDQRFDQDLRSVLLEDAPREVPDDLRRRVAAVPTAHPAASTVVQSIWRQPVPRLIGALAAVLVVLAIGLWQVGPAGDAGVGAAPSSSATSGAHSSPSPGPSESVEGTACVAADLVGRVVGWQGAAGSRIADVEISNTTPRSCFVRGTPGLQLVDARGRVLIDSATAGPGGQPHVTPTDPSFELLPDGRVRTDVRTSNYCGLAPSPPIDIAFTLPSGGGRFIAVPGDGVSSAEGVPPCLGPTGGQIEMNGWRR